MDEKKTSRRQFLKGSVSAATVAGFPALVPARVFSRPGPNDMIQVAQIGCGRIARHSEIKGMLDHSDLARVVAVCDLDAVRAADAKRLVESAYAQKFGAGKYAAVKTYGDYREMLQDKSIDAVCISTPDHWHAQPAMEAALAGKDIYLQKPASLTIKEGRQMADTVTHTGRIFQQGSQQRSEFNFRYACELVRNGRIGKVQQILIGLPADPAGNVEPEMPVPRNLNYEMWLGSTPLAYYTEKRVHPQRPDLKTRYGRPGWLRCEQFGAGMITGWGAHHIDIAHWGMGTEHTGPVEIVANAEFPKKGLWDVHGPFHVRAHYANGADVFISDKYPTGVKFIGEYGWIWVTRGAQVTPSDPAVVSSGSPALDASDRKMLAAGIKPDEIHLHHSPQNDHHLDWLASIRTRRQPAAPVEVGHRSCTACLLAHTAMKLDRTLKWDPQAERYINDEEANATLSRFQRAPYGTDRVWARGSSKS
ncbi:MAG TPA: Gfo/Idh/MocA family oxidoreductase [Terriglobia bacterium]|nr:Gfo/Idh/MocA family oxidoreductase [Terriglobia bacterium]